MQYNTVIHETPGLSESIRLVTINIFARKGTASTAVPEPGELAKFLMKPGTALVEGASGFGLFMFGLAPEILNWAESRNMSSANCVNDLYSTAWGSPAAITCMVGSLIVIVPITATLLTNWAFSERFGKYGITYEDPLINTKQPKTYLTLRCSRVLKREIIKAFAKEELVHMGAPKPGRFAKFLMHPITAIAEGAGVLGVFMLGLAPAMLNFAESRNASYAKCEHDLYSTVWGSPAIITCMVLSVLLLFPVCATLLTSWAFSSPPADTNQSDFVGTPR